MAKTLKKRFFINGLVECIDIIWD